MCLLYAYTILLAYFPQALHVRSFTTFTFLKQNHRVKGNEVGRACSTHGEKRNLCRVSVGVSREKRPVGLSRRRWEDNIKMGLEETGWGCMDWIDLVQDSGQ
jgi:hypothetical protein